MRQRPRLWPSIKPTSGQCFIFADYIGVPSIYSAFVHRVHSALTLAHCFERLAKLRNDLAPKEYDLGQSRFPTLNISAPMLHYNIIICINLFRA